jgi:hypothetical protein
VGVLDPGGV